ncbi:hypothetical protein [Methylocapsa aurea]|uniref:hypothetical protein n=1 Tax=Methylocapsa aurea TaxID=663610 RepID=UPI0005655E2F|nr:hypothetical protein [Methylocapsa aurea]
MIWVEELRPAVNEFTLRPHRLDFPTFEEAVRHFMTDFAPERREITKIVTASGEEWFLKDIGEIFDESAKAGT